MAPRRGFDPATVARAQAGDDGARSALLRQLEPLLRAFFIKRLGVRSEVDDLVQNTLVRVHTGLEDLKDPGRLKSFTMKAALFELQDLYRGRYGPKERVYDPDLLPEPAATDGAAGAGVDAERALALLSPRARRIMELRAYGYRYEEIAREVDTTEAAVKMQVKRAFDKMRAVLAGVLAGVLVRVLLLG